MTHPNTSPASPTKKCGGLGVTIGEVDSRSVRQDTLCPGCDDCTKPPAPESASEEKEYPCDRCGKLRTVAEGGTIFTVCDTCWDATRTGKAPDTLESLRATIARLEGEKAEANERAAEMHRRAQTAEGRLQHYLPAVESTYEPEPVPAPKKKRGKKR